MISQEKIAGSINNWHV